MTNDGKSQAVRLLDVFVLGPVMILAGTRLRGPDKALGAVMVAVGVGTVLYNARNWRRIAAG